MTVEQTSQTLSGVALVEVVKVARRDAWNDGYMACLFDIGGIHDRVNIEHPSINPYGEREDE